MVEDPRLGAAVTHSKRTDRKFAPALQRSDAELGNLRRSGSRIVAGLAVSVGGLAGCPSSQPGGRGGNWGGGEDAAGSGGQAAGAAGGGKSPAGGGGSSLNDGGSAGTAAGVGAGGMAAGGSGAGAAGAPIVPVSPTP